MKTWLAVVFGMFVAGGVTEAQTTPPVKGYIEGVAQSAFGNATSQSYGAEGGITIKPGLLVFVEGGRTNNVAPSSLESDALVIGGYLSHTQSGTVSYTAKEPVAFGVAGLKYQIATT